MSDNNYKCKYSLYHDKPVKNNEPSSNNGWLYTSMAMLLGVQELDMVHFMQLRDTYNECLNTNMNRLYFINRLPNKAHPPISRDEVIGLTFLGSNLPHILMHNKWYMFRTHKIIWHGLIDQLRAIWSMRNEHRNYFWQNGVDAAYPIAMRIWWHDRYYMKKVMAIRPTIFEFICFYIYAFSIVKSGSAGEKNLLTIQLADVASKGSWLAESLLNNIDVRANIREYFGTDHIFYKKMRYYE